MPEYTPPTPDGFFDQFFKEAEGPPDGWKSVEDVCLEFGISRETARGRLYNLVIKKKMQRKRFASPHKGLCWYYGPPD